MTSTTIPPLAWYLNPMGCSATVAAQCGATKTRMVICTTPYLNSSSNSFVISSSNCTTANSMSDNSQHSINNTEYGSCSNSEVITNSCLTSTNKLTHRLCHCSNSSITISPFTRKVTLRANSQFTIVSSTFRANYL